LYADVVLVQDGVAKAAIYVSPDVMKPDLKNWKSALKTPLLEAEADRQRLRESVNDLAHYLEKMSGAKIEIVTAESATGDQRVPVLIGKVGAKSLGPVGASFAYRQAFRMVVSPKGLGLMGESDLATSYAIYELLDRLGCRWYMPSDLGEVVPELRTITLRDMDATLHPSTICRRIDYVDEAFKRRNRVGGLFLYAHHALEGYITKEQRQEHPEWCATVGGKLQTRRLKWSNPQVAEAIAARILANLEKTPQFSVSISPDDGSTFDDSPEDKALDAGDFDASCQTISITDRYLVLCNRIAQRVAASKPDVLLGMLAYVQYTRPPVREKVPSNIVPMIAPITFSRAHPMTDDAVPDNKTLRYIVEGWGRAASTVSYYAYGYNLAEVSAPNPMITKWGIDIPIALKNNCKFWMPETMPNFETCMPAIYMANRLAWDSTQKPEAIIDELMQKFYGHAAREMATYWRLIDDAWVKTPEYSGCHWGYLRRFPPSVMNRARKAMDAAKSACRTPTEQARVELADLSLQQFELYMKLRRDLAEGRWTDTERDADHWRDERAALTKRFAAQSAFGPYGLTYFDWFCRPAYKEAARIARDCRLLLASPIRSWRYTADAKQVGENDGWFKPEFDDQSWKTTDPCIDTWSALGYHSYLGQMWYRANVDLSIDPSSGKKVSLWIGNSDGSAKVFINGQHVRYNKITTQPDKTTKTELVDAHTGGGFEEPASFDITPVIRTGRNQITILSTRSYINELGVGGLLGPVTIYVEK